MLRTLPKRARHDDLKTKDHWYGKSGTKTSAATAEALLLSLNTSATFATLNVVNKRLTIFVSGIATCTSLTKS